MTNRLRTSDKEEIEELRKRLEECKKENEELQKQIALLPISKFDLTERQKSIIHFITNNPGKSKEDIVKKLTSESKGSRVTILKDINKLENEYKMIVSKKDKPNSQIYKLYINQDSVLLDTYNNLNNFKRIFIDTIDKLINDKNWYKGEKEQYANYSIISALILIYVHILNTYITFIVLEWSNKYANNPPLLNKLYSLIFFNFMELNLKLVNTFQMRFVKPISGKSTFMDFHSPLTQGFIYNQYLLKPHIILNILKEYRNKNLHLHIFPLLDNAWKISLPIYKYTSMMGPAYNEIKYKPLKQIYNINYELPLLLFHYVKDYSNSKEQELSFPRYTEQESIPQLFDIPLQKNDEEIYKPILADVLGQEKCKEIERRYLINRLIGFLEYIQELTYQKETVSEWMKENPNNQEFNKKCLKFIQTEDNFLLEISNNKHISKMLKIAVELRDSKLNDSVTLRDSISIEELKSFFDEIKRFSVMHEKVISTYHDVNNFLLDKSKNKNK